MQSRMILIVGLTLVTAGVVGSQAGAQSGRTPEDLRARVDALATELHPAIIEIRRDIHRNPELGFRETRTAALVADRLRALKFDEVRTGVGGTGVVGVLKGARPGPVVAVRADMDALPVPELIDVPYKSIVPNVKHACGHDGHTAMALGVAEIFARMRVDLPGTVVFLFQPAEEGDPDGGPTGALKVLDDWPLTNPTPAAIFGLHVMPTLHVGKIGYNSGGAMASADRFTIKIIGKSTHGAMPHTGIDPVPIAAQVVEALQMIPARQIDAQKPTVVSVGTISGGSRFNIIADSVTMTGTVRSLSEDGPSTVKAKMTQLLQGITSASGATFELEYVETAPVTFNNPALVTASLPALEAAVGAENLVSPPAQMVAEDFAFYQKKIPGFYFFLGVANPDKGITAMWHTEYFDIDEDALRIGMKAMASVVLQYLSR
ncbi:MAG: amidohydrolase [Acidobacteria bacterium]|jgi:amidohydrolase|nr:amidohydrolase [Acidobacteriota bacterium]